MLRAILKVVDLGVFGNFSSVLIKATFNTLPSAIKCPLLLHYDESIVGSV